MASVETRTYSPIESLMRQGDLLARTKVAPGWHRGPRHKRGNGVKTGRATANHRTIELTPAQKRALRQAQLVDQQNAAPRSDRELMARMGTIHAAD